MHINVKQPENALLMFVSSAFTLGISCTDSHLVNREKSTHYLVLQDLRVKTRKLRREFWWPTKSSRSIFEIKCKVMEVMKSVVYCHICLVFYIHQSDLYSCMILHCMVYTHADQCIYCKDFHFMSLCTQTHTPLKDFHCQLIYWSAWQFPS